MVRGDSATISLSIQNADGSEYTILPTDSVTMMVRKTPTSEVVISKTLDNGVLNITPADTSNLPFGSYVYDIQIVHGADNGWTDTIIPVHQFNILQEVTYGGD
jgi:hypothetical protein